MDASDNIMENASQNSQRSSDSKTSTAFQMTDDDPLKENPTYQKVDSISSKDIVGILHHNPAHRTMEDKKPSKSPGLELGRFDNLTDLADSDSIIENASRNIQRSSDSNTNKAYKKSDDNILKKNTTQVDQTSFQDIVKIIQYHGPTKTLSCEKNCIAKNRFEALVNDRFGIVSWVRCTECNEVMSLEMNTPNSHKLTVIETADDLKLGDEVMFRRWYGISHHAIYLGKKETKETNGCCSRCSKCFRITDDVIDVISHTYDEEKGNPIIKKSREWLQGGIDVYRVEYDSCYPPKWTIKIANRAEQNASKGSNSTDSSYDPLMENCEHFARRCKTGQSESRQVQACLYNCGTNIAMLALRVAILATWWIAEAAIKDNEPNETVTHSQKGRNSYDTETIVMTRKDLTTMEVIAASSLCILFTTLKVVFSSIHECRKIRYQETSNNEQHHDTNKKAAIGACGKSCSECCCKCCPKRCYGFRYFCRMLCCSVPIRLCKEICCTGYSTRCSCEFKCKRCCDDKILKFCCRQYVVITLRVLVSEVIVVGIPIAFFATFEWYCKFPAFRENSLVLAAYGFLFTFPLVLVLSVVHSCISNILSRAIGWCCHRCYCCCFCCCSFKDA